MIDYTMNPLALFLKFALKHNLERSIKIEIASNSMFPTLRRGDTAFVFNSHDYEVGDIIAYAHLENSITVHRIIRINDNLIYTKGDNNLEEDNYYLTQKDIIGKVRIKENG